MPTTLLQFPLFFSRSLFSPCLLFSSFHTHSFSVSLSFSHPPFSLSSSFFLLRSVLLGPVFSFAQVSLRAYSERAGAAWFRKESVDSKILKEQKIGKRSGVERAAEKRLGRKRRGWRFGRCCAYVPREPLLFPLFVVRHFRRFFPLPLSARALPHLMFSL